MGSGSTIKRRLSSALTAVVLAVALLGLHMPSASAASWFDDSKWVRSAPSFNTKMICIYTCQIYTLAMADIAWQGPEGRETEIPKVGDRFYIRVRTSVVFPFDVQDSYQMRVLLPAGVTPDIQSSNDVLCAITDVNYNTTRNMPANECQDPVRNGVYQQFPPVTLNRSEVAWFFFPVKASQPMTNAVGLGLQSDPISNPENALPDPLWSPVALTVAPAPVAPGPGPGPGPGPAPGPGPGPAPGPAPGPDRAPGPDPAPGPGSPATGHSGSPQTGPGAATAPAGVKVSTKYGTVVLKWKKSTAAVAGYFIQVLKKGKWVKAGKAAPSAKKFSWSKAKRGKRYAFRVAMITSSGLGPWSTPIRVRVK